VSRSQRRKEINGHLKTNLHFRTRPESFGVIQFHLSCNIHILTNKILRILPEDRNKVVQTTSEVVPETSEFTTEILRILSRDLKKTVPKSSDAGSLTHEFAQRDNIVIA
jgi:hypothetical protein